MPTLIRRLRQPPGSSLCGQTCVAMAAGVSIETAIKAVGHDKDRGTYTKDVVRGLRALGLECADRARVVSRKRPMLPKRALIVIHRPPDYVQRKPARWHWMLTWDGEIFDPEGCWPNYKEWRITSVVEIYS